MNDPTSDFERALSGTTSTALGALEAGELAATVMVGHDGHRGWVDYLAGKLGKRRHGLGRSLMQKAEGWLRERGAVKLHLMIRDDNAEARGFYRQLGYEDTNVTVLARWLADPA